MGNSVLLAVRLFLNPAELKCFACVQCRLHPLSAPDTLPF